MRLLILPLALASLAACGRKSSGEFDERPPIPMAPVAEPVAPAPDVEHSGMDVRPGEDLRGPRGTELPVDDPSALPARGPQATPTYTYVPVPSPRELPGEKVQTSPPASTPAPRTRTWEPGTQPAEIPVPVAAPSPPGAPAGTPESRNAKPDLKP